MNCTLNSGKVAAVLYTESSKLLSNYGNNTVSTTVEVDDSPQNSNKTKE